MKKTIITLLALLGMSQAVAQESDYLPTVREGVKWVNEKVIVNHGDTTRYYYNYELSGTDTTRFTMMGEFYDACYYYLGDELNVETDSLIAGLHETDHVVRCLRNNAYDKVLAEQGELLHLPIYSDGGTRLLYNFESADRCYYYYKMFDNMMYGIEPVITKENLIEVEPVTIEGMECFRMAYLGEDGEPLAYIVQGIGFDSYDMGDLLTPFTRQPDRDADYQEWCGLSHVVKDGQIIYKGMRYRHDAFTGIDGVVAKQPQRPVDPQYYNLMGQPVGQDVPTTPGIYIHQGKKVVVR